MKEKQTTKPQTKLPVDREAVRVLAIELGVPAAACKLGLNRNTVHSWARRYNWNLPERAGRPGIVPARDLHTQPGDVVLSELKVRETATRTAMSIAALNGANEAAALEHVLPEAAKLQALGAFVARTFGWSTDQRPSVNYYGDVNTVVVCDENRRKQLIEQRQRLLEQEATQASGREVETAVPVSLPAPQTQAGANVDTGNGIVAENPSPVAQPDPVFQHMQSIGRAESWKTSEPENHAGMFGPYPEELE